jgi:predicted Fe-S protein YdhL (DUF1289 family)
MDRTSESAAEEVSRWELEEPEERFAIISTGLKNGSERERNERKGHPL